MRRLGLLALCLAGCLLPGASKAEIGGITISPPLRQVVLSTSGPTPVSFSVTNNSTSVQTYQLRAVDFKALSESGGVAFLGQNVSSQKYGLAKSLVLDSPQITLQPRETRDITASIPPNVSPGGHYCAILLASSSTDTIDEGNLNLQQVSSALVFAIKSGGAKYDLRFDSFVGLPKWSLDAPGKLRLRFHNAGNVQAVPRGIVQVVDPLGRVVGKGTINSETGIVLPESYRRYAVEMDRVGRVWLPGIYQVKAMYRYEGTEKFQTSTQTILVVNWYAVVVMGGLFVLSAALAAWLWLRRQKHRLL